MHPITFFDTEIDPKSGKVLDLGAYRRPNEQFHSKSEEAFKTFLSYTSFFAGHNILRHDLKYIQGIIDNVSPDAKFIDTLDLSPLLFPKRPYHNLVKDDKLITEELNNPLNDAIKASDLFHAEVNAFNQLEPEFQSILFGLLQKELGFSAFFECIDFDNAPISLLTSIKSVFQERICNHVDLSHIIDQHPAELAYCLALIRTDDPYSIAPRWLNYSRPEIVQVMRQLRSNRCVVGCAYCNQANDAHAGLKSIFGFEAFRTFGGEALQENAVKAALNFESLLTVFPTGGGKSITFQLPALMQGQQNRGLTVIISPLQSLMKDQVDNLEKVGITSAVTINGLQDPIERSKSFERVSEGLAHLLYISPESLRSPSIEKLIQSRSINRFVIDEAHCFSSWGHDFRVDYLYIGEFIKNIQAKRQQDTIIPISCFTATAKPQVIDDIRQYFLDELNISLTIFQSKESRKNLRYTVYEQTEDAGKYSTLRDILTQQQVPSIVYVSRTKRAEDLARKLTEDGLPARPYHGQLDSNVKTQNQDAFLAGEVSIMVATSAFGMGVDKKDIGAVVHYDISDSLENYVQEAGRAGRDEKLKANCYILFDEEDLNKHFILQNNTRLTQKEINQIWWAIKDLTRKRMTISHSALEIARKAGWDDSVREIETRVKTAIAALEEAKYIRRKNNQSRVYADSLQYKTAQAAIDKINVSGVLTENEKVQAIRIVKSLISSKRTSQLKDDDGEARVEYLSDTLGIPLKDVIRIITLLQQEKLLADAKDLNAFIGKANPTVRLTSRIKDYQTILKLILERIENGPITIRLKEMHEDILKATSIDVTVKQIRTAVHFMAIKHWIKLFYRDLEKNIVSIEPLEPITSLQKKIEELLAVAPFIGKLLIEKAQVIESSEDLVLVDFSVLEIKDALVQSGDLQFQHVTREVVEDAIFYLTKIDALTIEGGFLVIYQRLMVERLEQNTRIQYKAEDYQDLERFYENKIQQVHIVGEYARKMIHDYQGALQFVEDYFRLNYDSFLNKYFPGRQNDIKRPITPRKFKELFEVLSPQQLSIVKDVSKHTAVLAGPGSGKTKVLVHKLASAVLIENLKHEQILMLTFSRSAVTEFKKRLYGLIGNAAAFIQIKTFHSYCFDLLGRLGDLKESDNIIRSVINGIEDNRIEKNRMTKLLLLIDEAQDMNQDEYELIEMLATQNVDMRMILVGDDDQNIFEFRNSSSKHLQTFISQYQAARYELLENFRSAATLVDFTNRFVGTIRTRLKTMPIVPVSGKEGEVSITECNHGPLTVAVADKIVQAELSGTTAVLCQSNQEAAEIHSLLRKQNVNARLIQSNEGFSLMNVLEVRTFVDMIRADNEVTISKESWGETMRKCKHLFQRSQWWTMLQRLWKNFEDANQKTLYVSDLIAFVSESRLEDFIYEQSGVVMISTYHKSKGREFDNVFVTITRPPVKDDEKRALYVAMTRAKHKLIIIANGNFLKPISNDVTYSIDNTQCKQPEELSYALTHEDVNLGFFSSKQSQIETLIAGDPLQINQDGCKDMVGHFMVRFSKKFQQTILSQKKSGYELNGVGKVNFIVYWSVEEGVEMRVVLPEVTFLRRLK
ncbi:MAG TPA: RecQ family ATP-dependent DNA helicase [Saprospiraceae bacterium]|nr:RecQ family ATP-dependent DNA helicase [Saprospiraceae bacterium]